MKGKKKEISVKKNVVMSTLKTFVTVFVPIITYPYVARILSIEDMGKINFSNSIVSYFTLLAALGIPTFAVREGASIKNNKYELNVFISQMHLLNWIFTFISLVIMCCLLFFIPFFKEYRIIIGIQSLTIVFTTIGMEWVNSIDEDFEFITYRTLFVQILFCFLIFAFIKKNNDWIAYVLISSMGVILGGLLNYIYVRRNHLIRISEFKSSVKYLSPIFSLFVNSVAITIYTNSDATMLRIFKNDYDVGVYGMATKIYFILKSMFGAALAVVLPRVTALLSEKKYEEYSVLIYKIFHIINILILPMIIGLIVYSSDLMVLFGGDKYENASIPFSILAIALPFAVIANFCSMILLLPKRKDKLVVFSTIMGAIVNIGLNFFFVSRYSYVGAAFTTFIAELLVAVCLYKGSDDKMKVVMDKIDLLKIIIASLVMLIAVIMVNMAIKQLIIRILVGIFVAILVYAGCLLVLKESIVKVLAQERKKYENQNKGKIKK